MVSTFLSYRLYAADFAKSTARTLADPQVSREAAYYRETIGSITSVDDFLKDQRLYAYAMKAHGLEDMTYAKAFMRKVLESDLEDADSFVRKLVDTRYIEFAKAFNFTPTGEVETGLVLAQDTGEEAETVGLYSQQRVLKGAAAAGEAEYYADRLATLSSVDQLVNDDRLLAVALEAVGLDPDIASKPAIREVLTSDLSDPMSAANRFGDARYVKLRTAFSFASDGSVPAGAAQTAAQMTETLDLYYDLTGNGASPAAAQFRTETYRSLIGTLSSVDDLVDNALLRTYALTAVGLDPTLVAPATVKAVLTSDLSDPDSLANQLGDAYRTLARAFNFAADGTISGEDAAQSQVQQDAIVDFYMQAYATQAVSAEETQTNYYKMQMATISSVDELLGDSRLFDYVVRAYGLDPETEPKSKIRQVLLSDPADTTSFARRLRDDRYTALAGAFNFGADGEALGPVRAQIRSAMLDTVTRYSATLGPYEIDKARGKAESEYYSSAIERIGSVDELLKDKRVVTYITGAFGFAGEGLSDQVLRQIFTSDLYDAKSFVNTSENFRFREMAAAFNFEPDGTAGRLAVGKAQDETNVLATQDLFVRQTLEAKAGDDNAGVRLALYFQRKAPTITSTLSILADKALREVVTTALGLPESVAQADVDTLARMIEKRLDVTDLKDPKKLDKFLARFAALYDIANPQAAPSVPSILLGQESGIGIGEDLLGSIQTLKLR